MKHSVIIVIAIERLSPFLDAVVKPAVAGVRAVVRQRIQQLFLIAAIAGLAACTLKTLYNQLDVLIPEYVEDMVTLEDVLDQKLEQRTEVLLSWHRNTQLKLYADWLRAVRRDVDSRLTAASVERRIAEAEQFWRSLVVKINDEMADLLPLLDREQQRELFLNIEDKNTEFREDYVELDEDERIAANIDRLTEAFENWIGELTDAQSLAVKQSAARLQTTAALRLQRRLEWQQGIRKILAEAGERRQKRARLRRFLTGFEDFHNEAMKQKTDANRAVIVRLTVQLANSMTQRQRAYFSESTDEYIRMFTELAENR